MRRIVFNRAKTGRRVNLKGARLISYDSLMSYLQSLKPFGLEEPAGPERPSQHIIQPQSTP
jgi:hypothetical protein